ncbi:insulin-like receptor [Drosophila ficusphila]|uniref:insulin-like receptor n=1 Tax=Drosophila ficusphila TaxID=30025 RepID=UPI0007E7247C|nr:insulin-like receptor [Drosophila ficusphila]XP_017057000.1 insulin-like receptor [Drosophila ficusphila]XP_017057001.1 insulin-like receptor [Drosophila ficusphila]
MDTTTKTSSDGVLSATATLTLGNICVLCRQEMLQDTCCCRQAVKAVKAFTGHCCAEGNSSGNSKTSSESSALTKECLKMNMPPLIRESWINGKVEATIPLSFESWLNAKVEATGKKRGMKCSRVGGGDENNVGNTKNHRRQREKLNIFSNCHNILRTLQSLLLLMFNCGIFNKRRRRQQQHQQQSNVNFTKFLLLLETMAAATTRLSLSPNNYNQQQLKHNQQLPHKKQQSEKQDRYHYNKRHYHHWNSGLIWIFALNIVFIHATASIVLPPELQHLPHNDIADNLNALSVSTHSRPPRSQSNETMRLSQNIQPCKSLDIRNLVSGFSQLENCTVIEGFLLINLINDASPLNRSFPKLTEVTEFVVVYRVTGLHSLSKVFPNLSIIRGVKLIDGYALVVYSNMDLTDLGLPRLRAVTRGGIRIERNRKMCYDRTIDWLPIMSSNATQSQVVLLENAKPQECEESKCPGELRYIEGHDSMAVGGEPNVSCREYGDHKRFCWDSKVCQTFCPEKCRNNCLDEDTCCSNDCLGGCVRDQNGKESCIGCRNFSLNNVCVDSCPKDYYIYDSRCVTWNECIRLVKFDAGKELPGIPYEGQCAQRCPPGFMEQEHTCVPCPGGKCEKPCKASLIDSLERARELNGCTSIYGNTALTISIKRESGAHVMEELEFGLGAIHTIETSLMVHLTYGLKSLRFFQSLTEIRGESNDTENFALYVLENRDLEELWNPNQTVFIRNGGVFFHFNPKLCVSTINKLLPMLASKPTSFDKRDVAIDSNGNRGSCGTAVLNVTLGTVSSFSAELKVTSKVEIGDPQGPTNATIIFKDPRAFIGFVFYHMRDPYRNASKGSEDPCDDRWKVSSPDKSGSLYVTDLIPYTWYAYYVRTMAISSEATNAESEVHYFRTNPGKPSRVTDVMATAISDSKINLTWSYQNKPYGKLARFFVKAKLISRPSRIPNRDYCGEPLVKALDYDMPPTTPTKKTPDPLVDDCKCVESPKKTTSHNYDDRVVQAGMEFENALQNFIFVPSSRNRNRNVSADIKAMAAALDSNAIPNGGGMKSARQKRELVLEPEIDNGSVLLRHVRSLMYNSESDKEEATYTNESVWSANKEYYEVFAQELPPNQTSFVFQNLRHFTRYTIFVVACREAIANDKGPFCSAYDPVFPTTKRKDFADLAQNLTVVPEHANNTESSVRVRWFPPVDPNGLIVTYEIAYKLQKLDQVEEKKCIPVEDFNQTMGYPLKLNEGKYSFRVRANSLAGFGEYTELKFIEVEPPPSYAKYFIWLAGTGSALLIISLIGYVRHLRKRGPSRDLHMNTEVNPFYASMQYVPDDWEVLRDNIIQLAPLGQGSFGMVYEGILKALSGNGVDRPCAIKTVNENATDRERINFLSEASVMKEFDTYHVVRLLGVCSRGQPALVVMELMKKGDLKSYLRAHRPEERDEAMMAYLHRIGVTGNVQPPTYGRIYQMAIEIADGMAYLAAKKFVHRDLAARNCMVAEDLTVKIGDFGMTRDVYETDYYRKDTKGLLPVRWMPPESLKDGVYSSASDVFSFGVVLWEMATLAAQPYQGLSNDQVLRFVIDGGVMEKPENCPDVLHKLMQRCWQHRPSARPSFLDIISYLEQQCPDSNFKDVSFYHSEAGQQHREKERKERSQLDAFAAVPLDQDQQEPEQQEDATTPLRMGDSSLDQPAESPIALVDDQGTHSPFSMQSGLIASSTPDGQTVMPTAFQNLPAMQGDDTSAYVQPDPEALGGEAGYELYDPSPKVAELPTSRSGSTGGGGKLSGEQHLLPKKTRQPVIMSSSMPDDVIGGSSLQPSTASAASSNASSHTGRYPSLKRVVADTLRNRTNMFNRHLFNHKRTGSNASHKSTASNAPSTSSNSNLTSHPVAMGNLGTIESGGSGSAGSYTGTPRFYTPTTTPIGGSVGLAISDNPNYGLLDESVASDQATILTTSSPNPNYEMMHPPGSQISKNPNYMAMNNPSQPVQMAGVTISHNPNYQQMQAPQNARHSSSDDDNGLDEDDEDDDDVDDEHVEHIKMERMPLSRPRQKAVPSKTQPPRSRSVSQTRKSPTNPNSGVGTTGTGNMSNLLKESWLRPASTPRPPPPNGFIGREA